MQNFYKLQQGKMEKVMQYVTQLEEALNAVQQEHLTILSVCKLQQQLKDHRFHKLCKQLHDVMCYLYNDMRITYPQLLTAA